MEGSRILRSIVIKKADKGSCVVVWNRLDYVKEAEKQLGDSTVYEEINYNKKILSHLVDSSNKYFKKLTVVVTFLIRK